MKKASWLALVVLSVSLASHAQVRPRQGDDSRRRDQPTQPLPQPQYDRHDDHRVDRWNDPYDQRFPQNESVEARIQRSMIRGQRLRLSQYLYPRQAGQEVLSLSIRAQAFSRLAQIQVLSRGLLIQTLQIGQFSQELQVRSYDMGSLDQLELVTYDDVYLDTVSAELESRYVPREYPVAPNSLVQLRINQNMSYGGQISLDQLVRDQLGQSLQGAEIERVIVNGDPMGRSQASVGVELNGRLVGPMKFLSIGQRMLPLQVNSFEQVRSLRLIVQGPAQITEVSIRVGRVRP